MLLDHTADIATVHADLLVACFAVSCCSGPFGCQAETLATDPGAAVVAVAVDQSDVNAARQQIRDVFEPGSVGYVPAQDSLGDVRVFGEVDASSEGLLDPGFVGETRSIAGRLGAGRIDRHVEGAAAGGGGVGTEDILIAVELRCRAEIVDTLIDAHFLWIEEFS